MAEVTRKSGIRVKLPTALKLLGAQRKDAVTRQAARRRLDRGVMSPRVEQDALVAAFEDQDFQVLDALEVQATAPRTRRREGATPGVLEFELHVPIKARETAVVLAEQDGVYAWHFAMRGPVADAAPTSGGTSFTIRVEPVGVPPKARRGKRFLKRFFIGKVTAYVLKFVAEQTGRFAMPFLERNVQTGLVLIDSPDPGKWAPLDRPLTLPDDRVARVLLLMHGTFSSTVGAFGALGSTLWGRGFLEAALRSYDAVLGFDHKTLSVDPLANAADLLDRLEAIGWREPPQLDVITHSRGGLVFRSLMEHLLPASSFRPETRRAVFVGCPNAGTRLAQAENWHHFADLYTNLAVAACRAIAILPQATAVSTVVTEIVKGVGGFVKSLASHALAEGGIPGLAAMQPQGDFVRTLNAEQPNQPTIDQTYYCAITSEFDTSLASIDRLSELPPRLLAMLAGQFMHRFMEVPNDLVVDTDSMTAIDRGQGNYVKERLDFGRTAAVYHCNYFSRPEVTAALARWLGMPLPSAPSPAPLLRRAAAATARANVHDRIAVATADRSVEDVRVLLETRAPDFVVVHRREGPNDYRYAFTPGEIRSRIAGRKKDDILLHALDLHESDASAERLPHEADAPAPRPHPQRPSGGRTILMHGVEPIAVLRASDEIPDTDGLLEMSEPRAADGGGSIERLPRHRRRGRGEPTPLTKPVAARPEPGAVECHFQAGMDDEIVVDEPSTVEVTLSREAIEEAARAVVARGSGRVAAQRKIIVEISPRQHIVVDGDSRVEVDLPKPSERCTVCFDVHGVAEGEGELVVLARQGPVPIVTLCLTPRIVKRRTERRLRQSTEPVAGRMPEHIPPSMNRLRITEQRLGNRWRYAFDLDIPGRRLLRQFHSELVSGDLTSYLAGIYKLFEDAPVETPAQRENFAKAVLSTGLELYEQLIPREMQALLWEHKDSIDGIHLLSTEPFVPWEILHLTAPGQRARPADGSRFFAEMGLVRWLWEDYPPSDLRVRKGRAYYVIPSYPLEDDALPEAEAEAAFLKATFGAKALRAESKAVMALLESGSTVDLLHFACHGEATSEDIGDARLLMEGSFDDTHAYVEDPLYARTVAQLATLARNGKGAIVVLNACQIGRAGRRLTSLGGFAHAFLRAGSGVFVGTLWSVGDAPARTFTETFYRRLKAKQRLVTAAKEARHAARNAGDATWLAYVVYGDPHARLA